MFQKLFTHSVTRNSSALFLLQFVSLIAPLVVLPYLSRVLGVEGFGLIMVVISISAVATIIIDFGFDLSATAAISQNRNDVAYVSKLIGAVFQIKCSIALLVLVGILFYSQFIGSELFSDKLLLFVAFNILVQAFIPTYFFQGIERMKNITIFIVCAKLAYILMVIYFIKEPGDFELVILLIGFSNLVSVCVAIRLIYVNGYSVTLPTIHFARNALKNSSTFFLSRAALAIYTEFNTFLVGAFAGIQQAAFYGASEKLFLASKSISAPIVQALYPYMAKNSDSKLMFKICFYVGGLLLLVCGIVFVWANEVMTIIFGSEFKSAGTILQIFLAITVVNFFSQIFGYPAFAGIGRIDVANYTIIFGAGVQIFLLSLLFINNSITGVNIVLVTLISEIFVLISRLVSYKYYEGFSL
ncbi:oligosaccharide flippase family protein [Gammaproteobacteria bacterium]|nr:oligosaccharide flippase family protein [Gammaproteobacteria bacterium]